MLYISATSPPWAATPPAGASNLERNEPEKQATRGECRPVAVSNLEIPGPGRRVGKVVLRVERNQRSELDE